MVFSDSADISGVYCNCTYLLSILATLSRVSEFLVIRLGLECALRYLALMRCCPALCTMHVRNVDAPAHGSREIRLMDELAGPVARQSWASAIRRFVVAEDAPSRRL